MKELEGNATAAVAASADDCLALLKAVDRYPSWYPDVVRSVDVLERGDDGQPSKVHAMLHMAQGPLTKDFDLTLAVTTEPAGAVKLIRVPDGSGDQERFEVDWYVDSAPQTQIRLELRANLSVPRFLPLGGIGASVADGFVAAAARALA